MRSHEFARVPRLQLGWLMAGAALAVLLITGCTGAAQQADRSVVRLITGLPGAGFNPLGRALATAFSTSMPEVAFEILESGGSVANVDALQQGRADVGLAFADVAYIGYSGRLDGTAGPLDELRGIAVLQLTPVHILVRDDAPCDSMAELSGARVALGPAGSGTALTAQLLLETHGLATSDVQAERLPFTEAAARMRRGTLDAAFVVAGYPAEAVAATMGAGARLIEITGDQIATIRHAYPFLRAALIPARTYRGQEQPVQTVGVDTLLICRAGLDEDLVYELTKRFFEAIPALAADVSAMRTMDLDRTPATPIPLHDGAARFYRERELSR